MKVRLRSITEVNRTQLRYWVRLSLINQTFDLVRLVSPGKDENKTKALGKKYNFSTIVIFLTGTTVVVRAHSSKILLTQGLFSDRFYLITTDFIRECCMSKITWEMSYIYLDITFIMQVMFTDLTLNP